MKWHRILANGFTVVGIGVACFGLLGGVTTTKADQPTDKVTICHRTASHSNPYNEITVDRSAVDGMLGNSGHVPDHYGRHQGPIGPIAVGEWGDIIPPVSPYHSGLNWTAEGQAIWENDCNIPTPTTEAPTTEAPTTEAPTTEAPTTVIVTTTEVESDSPTTVIVTTTEVESDSPTTTLAPSTTAVSAGGGNLPSTGQGPTMLIVGGLLMAMTGLTLRGLARRTA